MRRASPLQLILALGLAGCSKTSAPAPVPREAPSAEASAETPLTAATAENPTPMPSASVEAFRNPMHLPEYSGPTGSVEGTITIVGDAAPDRPELDFRKCPLGRDTYGKLFREGPPLPGGNRPVADAIVAVTGYSGFYVPERSDVRAVTIRNCAFDSRTIDLTIGQRLEIANKSNQIFAPALAQAPMPALMVAPPNADPVRLYVPKPGYYTLIDRLGSDYMTADVYAVAYPLHTVTGLDGHYRIDGAPVGKMQVDARLPAIRQSVAKPVEIQANAVQHVDLQLTFKAGSLGGQPGDAGGRKTPAIIP